MSRYLVTIHRPEGYDPAVSENATMAREIDALNDAMVTAGIRVFVGGLQPPQRAHALRPAADGEVRVTEGPYLPTGEQPGGLWVLDVADLDEALAWGRRAALACRAAVEVRPFHER